MDEIAHDAEKDNVIGADIYELLDEPQLLTDAGVKPCQAQFGILDPNAGLTDAAKAVRNFLQGY